MILSNLRDTHPEMFPRRGPKLSAHELGQMRLKAQQAKRRRNAAKTNGKGKIRLMAARFAKFRASLWAMIFHAEIAAELASKEAEAAAKANAESQLAQTGGIELAPNG